jgi:hypothetical protein
MGKRRRQGQYVFSNYDRLRQQVKNLPVPEWMGANYYGGPKKGAAPLSGTTLSAPDPNEQVETAPEHEPIVGRYRLYCHCKGGTPIYHVQNDPIRHPEQDPYKSDFFAALDGYAVAYREQRVKWWGDSQGSWQVAHTIPYGGMLDLPFMWCKGAWVDLNPAAAAFGTGACAEWAMAIRNRVPKGSYGSDSYQASCSSFPGNHVSAYIYLLFKRESAWDKKLDPNDPLYRDRKKYVLMLDPWITGCPCIYSLEGWKREIGFSKETKHGMWE